MYNNPYASSIEAKILSATPMELVQMLYQAAIEAVQTARQQLSRHEIAERARSVSQAVAIIGELGASLDHNKGGELSTRLAAMYDYLQRILLDANFRQADDGLAAAEKLLKTLYEAWTAIKAPQPDEWRESHPCSYSRPLGDYAPRIANQWCA